MLCSNSLTVGETIRNMCPYSILLYLLYLCIISWINNGGICETENMKEMERINRDHEQILHVFKIEV